MVNGRAVPAFFYGTAWKEDATAGCVEMALAAGFRAIDTANQRKHYHEAGVGDAVRRWLATHPRDSLFPQTSSRMRADRYRLLVRASRGPGTAIVFQRSLEHLGVETIDCPAARPRARSRAHAQRRRSLAQVRRAHQAGRSFLGISNVPPSSSCCWSAQKRRPRSSRTAATPTAMDGRSAPSARSSDPLPGIRALTANRRVVAGPLIREIATHVGATPEQVASRLHVGMIVSPDRTPRT